MVGQIAQRRCCRRVPQFVSVSVLELRPPFRIVREPLAKLVARRDLPRPSVEFEVRLSDPSRP
jgi:hypothetical protein